MTEQEYNSKCEDLDCWLFRLDMTPDTYKRRIQEWVERGGIPDAMMIGENIRFLESDEHENRVKTLRRRLASPNDMDFCTIRDFLLDGE